MKRVLAGLAVAIGCTVCAPAWAQPREFPARPVRLVVPVPPGGSLDVMSRILSPKWGEVMGQNVIIDYRPGANTIVGSEHVARAPADGYTLLINTLPFVVNPALYPKMPFDTARDFAPVSLLGSSPFVLVVHPSVPAKSVKELIALAKARPGDLNYASAGNGSNLHVAAELFKNLTGTNIVHVPYGGGGPALIAILNGEAGLSFLSLVAVTGHIATGRMRALGITTAKRSKVTPQLPTIAEQGVAGYDFGAWFGVYAPAATPAPVVKTLNDAINRALTDPVLAERFDKEGAVIVEDSPVVPPLLPTQTSFVADPVFALEPAPEDHVRELVGARGHGPRIGLAVRPWRGDGYAAVVVEALQAVRAAIAATVIVFAFHPERDLPLARSTAEALAAQVVSDLPPREMMAAIGTMDILVGARLHALICAVVTGVPPVGLSYDPKVDALFRRIGVGHLLPLAGLQAAQFQQAVLAAWQNREETRSRLLQLHGSLREEALRAADLAEALLSTAAG